ncbi:hypothetical protein [Mycolicibacterium sp.]|uniref:hypothetical protein n=1 Tax=Mycolicibacterium sp. TaxID=2320850 RepID=UPI001A2D086A|nr:hypothetical protein [Mycolicibacterium sp.]MBJ7337615.1 hypothetical protein [Mycolicibacterium sp.]
MATLANTEAALSPSTWSRYGIPFISIGRIFAGALSWASPALSSRVFLLGRAAPDGRAGLLARLFGVRDVALGLALQHPSADVRKVALQAGVVIDSADVLATLLAVRAGAPKSSLLGVAAGAALFVGLALGAMADRR